MRQLFVGPPSGLGIAEDTRNALQRMRRREIWLKFREAGIEYDPQATKDQLIKVAVKKNLDLERAPMSEEKIILPELSIHELRRQVLDLTAWKERWNDVKKLTKDELKAVLNGDDPSASG